MQFNLICEDFGKVFSTFKVSVACHYCVAVASLNFLLITPVYTQGKVLMLIYFLRGLNYLKYLKWKMIERLRDFLQLDFELHI